MIEMRALKIVCAAALVAAAAGPVHAQDVKRLETAKAGQWIFAKSSSTLDGKTETRYVYQWIAQVDGRRVTVKTQLLHEDGKNAITPAREIVYDLDAKIGALVKPTSERMTDEVIEIKGKKLRCKKTEQVWDANNVVSRTIQWTSIEVPVWGLVRSLDYGQDGNVISRVELLDWGTSGGGEKRVK